MVKHFRMLLLLLEFIFRTSSGLHSLLTTRQKVKTNYGPAQVEANYSFGTNLSETELMQYR